MSSSYYHYNGKDYNQELELLRRINRDISRHSSHRPTACIVNDGSLVVHERTLQNHDANTIIHNRRGSTMWVQSSSPPRSKDSGHGHHHHHHHSSSAAGAGNYWVEPYQHHHHSSSSGVAYLPRSHYSTTGRAICRGCYERRSLIGGYCSGCVDVRTVRPLADRIEYIRDDRRLLAVPERRLLEYRQ
ncbi:hypothetical protein BX600DRAFT_263299 [Xylariales sp. PMI_506]|nr:hypothetical protein BX600DRAFT_263299 [Xylariales sp. PMI_506]